MATPAVEQLEDRTLLTALTISIDENAIRETGEVATGTVTRIGTAGALVVNLSSDDTGEATVPATVNIPDGGDSATFPITGVDDFIADGTQIVTVTASAAGLTDGTATINVLDNEQTNIVVTDVYLWDGNLNRVITPVLGERLRVVVEYKTFNLPGNANYDIHFSVDGVTIPLNNRTSGAGLASGNWLWIRSGWYAEPGPHTVTVTVDVNGDVAEDDETDNTGMFMFTPESATDLPQKFIWPLAGQPFQDHFVTNYVDLDPLGGIRDHNGGTASYNRHNAIDTGEANFSRMDEGVPIFAAADGVVITAINGGYDRNRGVLGMIVPGGPANLIEIDHGNGWVTRYFHLRRDSLHVEVGDSVSAGDIIAFEGSSGNSTASHVHFEVRHNDLEVATFVDPETFWQSPLGYVGDEVFLIESGISNYDVGPHLDEGPSEVTAYDQMAGIVSRVWGYFSGLRSGDLLQAVWHRPNNSVYATNSLTVPQNFSSSLWYFGRTLPAVPDLGMWTVEFVVNSVTTYTGATFEITSDGPPEIRIQDGTGEIVVDERYTPFDFGSVAQGAGSPTQTFTVINHGYDVLNISSIEVPVGFTLTEGLPATLAPGASDTFTVAFDTSSSGYFAGEVKVFSDDPDEGESNFSVEGRVSSGGMEQVTLGISRRRMDEGMMLFANVSRTGDTTSPLTVMLTSEDTSEITVPTTVTIPAGRSDELFQITSLHDGLFDGDQTVGITAAATGLLGAHNEVVVSNVVSDAAVTATQINEASDNRSGLGTYAVTFDLPVNVVGVTSLQLFNHTSSASVDISPAALSGNGTNSLIWDFTSVVLADGRYTAELPADQVMTTGGGELQSTHTVEFHVMRGDVNGDGRVNATDFIVVDANFDPLPGTPFRPGDGNGDGRVNATDFIVVDANFNPLLLTPLTYDFGDAPETGTSFPTTLANDGARHVITGNSLFLGASRDAEADGQPDATATGDGADEDSVSVVTLITGTNVAVTVTSSGAGFVNGWVDFNQDGDWDDPGEQVFTDQAVVAAANNLQIAVPSGATLGSTFARFRLTAAAGYSYLGLAPDGEVEDYQLTIADAAPDTADSLTQEAPTPFVQTTLPPWWISTPTAIHSRSPILALNRPFPSFGDPLSFFSTALRSRSRTH